MSATTDLGKVGITVNGTWSGSVAYEKNSIVNDGADSYISIQDVPIGTALSNTAYWTLLCNGFSSAEVVSAVDAWLVAHPEATTTVQDGAITTAKLADGAVTDAKLSDGSVTFAKLASDINDDIASIPQIVDKMVLVETTNKWNAANQVNGYVSTNGNRNTTSTIYVTLTEPISVSEGDVVRFYGKSSSNNFGSVNARFICAYDSSNNAVSASGSTSDTRSYTVPNGIASIIPSMYASVSSYMVTINHEVTEYEAWHSPYYVAGEDFLPDTIRKQVFVFASDTESQVIEKLVNAYETGNCDVIFERSHYSFGDGLAQVQTTYNLQSNEIPIGRGCNYFFNGATLEATINLQTLGTDFYCNLLGCQRKPTDYELHDGILIATDTRYVVHDESSALDGSYKHLYDNMVMEYRTSLREEVIRKCIGGGTGASGVIEILGCKFITDGTDSCVSYHGNANDVLGAEFNMNVRNNWFSNSMRVGALSEHQTGRLFYVGNSSGSALQTYDNWTVTAFLNEVRS